MVMVMENRKIICLDTALSIRNRTTNVSESSFVSRKTFNTVNMIQYHIHSLAVVRGVTNA